MSLFKRDTTSALASARGALAAAEAKIIGLEAARAEALVSSEDVEQVASIDRALDVQRQAAGIHRDRICALDNKRRGETRAQAEREKAAAIAIIEKRLAERTALAVELEVAINKVSDLFFRLIASREAALAAWSPSFPARTMSDLSNQTVVRETAFALYSAKRPDAFGKSLMPDPEQVPAVAGLGSHGIAGALELQSEVFIERLKLAPLVQFDTTDDDDDDQREDAA